MHADEVKRRWDKDDCVGALDSRLEDRRQQLGRKVLEALVQLVFRVAAFKLHEILEKVGQRPAQQDIFSIPVLSLQVLRRVTTSAPSAPSLLHSSGN